MIPQSPLEKVARALHEALVGGDADELIHSPAQKSWEEPTMPRWAQWIDAAHATLTALLDPDEGTLKAMADAIRGLTFSGYPAEQDRAIFNAAIQHIIKTDPNA